MEITLSARGPPRVRSAGFIPVCKVTSGELIVAITPRGSVYPRNEACPVGTITVAIDEEVAPVFRISEGIWSPWCGPHPAYVCGRVGGVRTPFTYVCQVVRP